MNKSHVIFWDLDIISDNTSLGDIEMSSETDNDLMRIWAFATHEGVNYNNFKFRREVLNRHYPTLIDKPLRVKLDFLGNPTGHGFDRKTKRFSKDVINVGHIVRAMPVIVTEDGEIKQITDSEPVPDGEYRILIEAVMYKAYYPELASVLINLHENGKLKFSIEASVDYDVLPDGVRDCTYVSFKGLAIVQNPAFQNSIGVMIAAEEKEEEDLDYETLYNAEKETNEALASENASLIAEKEQLETSVTELTASVAAKNTELAELNAKLADLTTEVASLSEYKQKFEAAEKERLGNERLEYVKKFGDCELCAEELAEMSEIDFSKTVLEIAEKAVSATITGRANFSTGKKNSIEEAKKIIADFMN